MAGAADLARNDHVQRQTEFAGDVVADDDAAARETQHYGLVSHVAVLTQLAGQLHAGIGTILQEAVRHEEHLFGGVWLVCDAVVAEVLMELRGRRSGQKREEREKECRGKEAVLRAKAMQVGCCNKKDKSTGRRVLRAAKWSYSQGCEFVARGWNLLI